MGICKCTCCRCGERLVNNPAKQTPNKQVIIIAGDYGHLGSDKVPRWARRHSLVDVNYPGIVIATGCQAQIINLCIKLNYEIIQQPDNFMYPPHHRLNDCEGCKGGVCMYPIPMSYYEEMR